MNNNYTPYMIIVPLAEWEALQKELAQLRAQMQTTVDPEEGYGEPIDIDDKIAEWYKNRLAGILTPLHEYLGMSWEGYKKWAESRPTVDPKEGYGELYWKAAVDIGKRLVDEKGNEVYKEPFGCYVYYPSGSPTSTASCEWRPIYQKMQQTKGWKVK